MATTKKRLNITLTPELAEAIEIMAKSSDMPQATKARELLEEAIKLHEDQVLAEMARRREESNDGEFVSHEELWDELLG